MVLGFASIDRGLALVTTPHPDGQRTILAVYIAGGSLNPTNSTYERINQPVSSATTIAGTEILVTSYAVPMGFTHYVNSAIISCSVSGTAKFYINGNLRALQRIGPGNLNIKINFEAQEKAVAGDTVSITFEARLNSAQTSVESNVYGFSIPS